MDRILYKVVMGIEHKDFNEIFVLENRYGVWTVPMDENGNVVDVKPMFMYECDYMDNDEVDLQIVAIKAALCEFNGGCYNVDGRVYGSKMWLNKNMDNVLERLDKGLDQIRTAYMTLKGLHND